MADAKISALTSASTPLVGTEVVPIVQSSTTKKVSVANLTSGRAVNMDSLTVGSTSSAVYGSKLRVDGGIETFSAQFNIALATNTPYEFVNRTTGGGFDFYVASAGKRSVRFLSAGDVSITDNLVIGTAGKGIDFSATGQATGMTSELLSDYEEGTWTPVVTSGSGSITGYTASGRYTKIGDTITVFGSINITAPGTASGNLNFSGLPFTAQNLGAYITTVQARENNVTGSNFSVIFAGNAATGIILGANWTTNVIYLFSATYQVQ